MHILYRGNVSTGLLPSNDKGIFTELLPSNDKGFLTYPSRCVATIKGDKQTHTQPHIDSNLIS
jgi:hypothetical protein